VGVIPFCDGAVIRFPKPKRQHPLALVRLGDHLLKRRLDLGHSCKAAAGLIGIDPETLRNYETGRTEPEVRVLPLLTSYLGYSPLPVGETRGARIKSARLARGLSRRRLAQVAGVDEATIKRMEEDVRGMADRAIRVICKTLGVTM
jgi:transcriptional regulator with XRE-family HTH domain